MLPGVANTDVVVVTGEVVVVATVVVDVVEVEVVVETGVAIQVGTVIVFISSVTAPLLANKRPFIVAPVVAVTLVKARIVPSKVEFVPSVAELPICQNTLQA